MTIHKINEWTPLVVSYLTTELGEAKFKKLCTLLEEYKGVIAGGSVLKSITNYDSSINTYNALHNDIDIYVNTKNIPDFLKILTTEIINPVKHNVYWASTYCVSFLRKNGIRRVYQLNDKNNKITVDVMSVRNKRTLEDVVTNFDLTFCQVWFDGKDVYATHPKHIRTKIGSLQKDYIKTYLNGNMFLEDRIRKYESRGFKINIDKNKAKKSPDLYTGVCQDDNNVVYTVPRLDINSKRTKRWINSVALKWTLGMRDDVDKNEMPILMLPLNKQPHYKSSLINQLRVLLTQNNEGKYLYLKGNYNIVDDDGYDSEDIEEQDLIDISVTNYNNTEVELARTPIDPKLIYSRTMFNLLINFLTENTEQYKYNFAKILNTFPFMWRLWPGKYFEALKKHTLRKGDDFLGDTGILYDIHNHPIDGSITQDSLEGYLTGHIKDVDKDAIPCYWKPEPEGRNGINPKNCQHKLSLKEIQAIVSREFYEKFTAPAPIKSGLNQIVNTYNATLFNKKSTNTEGFGDLYHASMCPFCLQFEQREDGCAYMGHANPKRLPSTAHPYCQKDFIVNELREKYLLLGRRLDPGFDHLEFCVECGRPCWNHKHFKLDESGFVENPMIGEGGQRRFDYGKCVGGGRTEMFARILAVRSVYANKNINKPKEERKAAALLADEAPNNRVLMERAEKIFGEESDKRKWNNSIPKNKKYNNIAYNNSIDGGRRKTRKLYNKIRKTRKLYR